MNPCPFCRLNHFTVPVFIFMICPLARPPCSSHSATRSQRELLTNAHRPQYRAMRRAEDSETTHSRSEGVLSPRGCEGVERAVAMIGRAMVMQPRVRDPQTVQAAVSATAWKQSAAAVALRGWEGQTGVD